MRAPRRRVQHEAGGADGRPAVDAAVLERLAESMGGDDAFVAELIEQFVADSPALVAAARTGLETGDAWAALFVAGSFNTGHFGKTLHMERNFFGVIRVTEDGKFVKLIHGTTLHGQQRADEPDRPPRPTHTPEKNAPRTHNSRMTKAAITWRLVSAIS